MGKNIDTTKFKDYVMPCYEDIIYLQYIKDLLIQNISSNNFLELFQKENFSLLAAYLLLLHNTLILEICKFTQKPYQTDDITLLSFLEKKEDCNVIRSINDKYKNLRNKKIGHLTIFKFDSNNFYEKNGNKLIVNKNYSDLFSFQEIDEDIEKIKKITQEYAAILDIKITPIWKLMKQRYDNFPTITSESIFSQNLFYPLI